VIHGENGFLAEVGDTAAMSQYALQLLTNPALYHTFREACIVRAKSVFCCNQIREVYENIYERILQLE
jgi:glycosyltransferase involved in cell wall biosynthesis